MAYTDINILNPNFEGIEDSLIDKLKSNEIFKDFNFKASNLRVLMDLLANNTAYNIMYLNMVGNEMFLDTALHRNSVISKAKELNYIPRSNTASSAIINIQVLDPVSTPVYMTAGTTFIGEPVNGISYSFVAVEDAVSEVDSETGNHTLKNVVIKQGVVVSESWVYDKSSNSQQIFTIGNKDIDISTLKVYVRRSTTDDTSTVYKLAEDYLTLTGDSEVYFIQEDFNEKYQFYFGDGYFGKPLEDGNVVEISYVVTSGENIYGVASFSVGTSVGGNYNCIIETVSESSMGSERESIESIKFAAPKSYKNQRRAVTDDDYKIVLQNNDYGFVFDSVNVWGEGNTTYVCCKPNSTLYLTENQKDTIINQILIPASVMTKQFRVVDPNYTFLKFENTFVIKKNIRELSENTIRALAKSAITAYCTNNLGKFDASFNATEMWKIVKESDDSIISYDFDLMLQKRILPQLDTFYSNVIYFDNAIRMAESKSVEIFPTFQQYDIDGVLHDACYLLEEGGNLSSGYYLEGNFVYIQQNVGSVDFDKGIVRLDGFVVHKINNDNQLLNITVKTKTRNVSVSENRIITLDTSDDSSIQTNIEYF